MMWIATNKQDVREVMNLTKRQREMTLRQYAISSKRLSPRPSRHARGMPWMAPE